MKSIKLLLLLVLSISLVACSSNDDSKKEKSEEKGAVEVDKGLLNVEVTLPASFFEGEDIDKVIAEAKKDGVKEVTKNEDGSLTYKMSKSQHTKMMKEMETTIKDSIKELETNKDLASVKGVEYNKKFTEFTIVVDQAAYENSMDGFAIFGLAMQSMFYQLFDGVKPDEYKATFHLKDEATSKVFDTVVYPDALQENTK
ncbi:hypothetical protein [Bacillus massiliigorillae]|uniref:hypothetical protein n=1 Tax=Bacillus massiliigorillae TaxID=1243664 RepID=UPI000399A30B|nr:hypothetical protein [Bacillus massiliigorillae]